MFLSILWVALLSLISLCRADGGAFETCDELYLSGQNLVGSCGTGGGDPPYEWNNIWLGWCVSNQSGNLQCEEEGNYGDSCQNCNLVIYNQYTGMLGCDCWTGGDDTGLQYTELNLNNCVGNHWGTLGCLFGE